MPAEFDCADKPPCDEAELGEITATIHGIAHEDGFGHLDDEGQGPHATWREALLATWYIDRCVERGAFEAELGVRLRALPE